MITFGIANDSNYDINSHANLERLIKSIEAESIPGVEIICCGDYKNERFKCINQGKVTISQKLNSMIEGASNEILVLIRDYMLLMPGWWKGFQKFGFDWDLAMCVVANKDRTRFRDWAVWHGSDLFPNESWIQKEVWIKEGQEVPGRPYLPNYSYTDVARMYISGGLFIGKTGFFRKHKFAPELDIGQAEDINFYNSIRLYKFTYSMNRYSGIILQKQKDRCLTLEHPYFGTWDYISKDLVKT